MKKKTLEDVFDEYSDLTFALDQLSFDYSREIDRLGILPVYKDVIEEYAKINEDELKQTIADFENRIIESLRDLIKYLKVVCKFIKSENAILPEEDIKRINRSHYWIEHDYRSIFVRIELKRKYYSDEWNFSKIDFSEIEDEKEKLDSAINEYNENNLKSVDYKLQGVYEIRKILKKQQEEFYREQEKKMKKEEREYEAYYEKHKYDI